MAFGVTTVKHNCGDLACVVNTVTGDGSTQTWDTGLSYVLFYVATATDDSTCLTDEWYYNYSDGGTTAAPGHVHYDEASAPADGATWTCFGIGKA
jgi:hypothetical protein